MALNIKDPETDALARRLAAMTGESITEAVREAMRERIERLQRQVHRQDRSDHLHSYIERGRRRPTLDSRTPEQILRYDDHGMPA